MVKETRILLDPGDITAVVIQCKDCAGELRFTLDKVATLPKECPYCMEPLGRVSGGVTVNAEKLHTLIRRLSVQAQGEAYLVRLETEDDA